MKFDLDFPQLELRLLIALFYRERFSNITQWIRIEFKIPWIKSWYYVYIHTQLIEFATMPKKHCWRFKFLNKMRRDFYDAYPQVSNGEKIGT